MTKRKNTSKTKRRPPHKPASIPVVIYRAFPLLKDEYSQRKTEGIKTKTTVSDGKLIGKLAARL
jgi:hypothetical protein